MRIILVRHGQTDHNAKKLMQGSGVNSILNQTGRLEGSGDYPIYNRVFEFSLICVALENPRNKRQNWPIQKFYRSISPQPCTHLL